MTEPERTDFKSPPAPDAERATRIEELLVSGLDHYFAAEYEQAINVWTRVIFLDREHDRARGDVERARALLTRAVEQGAPSDEALVLLERMDRLEGTGFDTPVHRRPQPV